MNSLTFKSLFAVLLLCAASGAIASAQKAGEWEFGAGGVLMNMTRVSVYNFRQAPGGDYIFNLDQKMVHGGLELLASRRLKDWLYLDLQATAGFARYPSGDIMKQGCSFLVEPGLQYRPFPGSRWIQPYLRVGAGYYRRNFPVRYFGQFDNDPTGEGIWKVEDAWNKGMTVSDDSFMPVSAGLGLIGWMGDRVGIFLQGDYHTPLLGKGQNFARISAGVLFKVGGQGRRKAEADEYVNSHPGEYDALYATRLAPEVVEKVVERVVEKEVPVTVEKQIPLTVIMNELLESVTFEFDSSVLSEVSYPALDKVAATLNECEGQHFLVAGYTDAKGSEEYNEELSQRRAVAVLDALVERGVPSEMLCSRGFGKRMAVVPESESDAVRQGDRKVVIERISDEKLWKYLNNR
ncbi:MAG: OmpA family protein [Candidatus Cryptobacteroides sp.]